MTAGSRPEVRKVLASGRARTTSGRAGLPVYGGHRRLPGLRREEVGLLVVISPDDVRLRRGDRAGVEERDGRAHAVVEVGDTGVEPVTSSVSTTT